jgi:formate dehydrogenase major subunit
MFPGSMVDSDVIVIMGSNMAENHPVAFRWVMQAKERGATLIHVDPRFTRTSAVADLQVPIRAGSDIAFLGGLIRYLIENDRYFKEYVVSYTNAATIISEQFQDTEDLDGVFSGLMEYTGDPINGFLAQYESRSWQYARTQIGDQGRAASTAQSGEQGVRSGQPGSEAVPPVGGPPYDPLVQSLRQAPSLTDPTLQDPRCVFQIVRRHFSRYTPEMVERVTGCPQARFLEVAETLAINSGPERTGSIAYAVAWTQHTYGVQMIGAAALLQLLLGNMGRPGGGIMALRGHSTIQGSTDIPTLYHSIHGYMAHPSTLKSHETVTDYLKTETLPTGYWANTPKFFVSYLKSMWGDAATAQNDFGYGWHPRIDGDYSHLPMMVRMADGKVRGMLCIGQNPATSLNGRLQRKAMRALPWLVIKDVFETETASFWYAAPEVTSGEVRPEDIPTEVFLFPSAMVAEMEGTYTNTQRLLQFHEKATDPPGDCRSDSWFTHQLALRLKRLYADSALPRDQGFRALTWDFDHDPGTYPTDSRIQGEPDVKKIQLEINGYATGTKQPIPGFANLKDDGSTTCASWIYCGMMTADGKYLPASRNPDRQNNPGSHLGWGFAWPANRRIIYNRASARPDGTPWSDRKKWVWWDGARWIGYDVPDFALTKAPNAPANPDAIGLDALSGTDAFIMKADGKGWLFAPTGYVDGPLPTHYEPVESPVANPLYPKQQVNPVLKYWPRSDNALADLGDPRFPIVVTTYRLTETYLSGAMNRWVPWLAALQPEPFVELSPELAAEKGIQNLDWVRVASPRGSVRVRALVTGRMRPFNIDGRRFHHVGLPWAWGYIGLVTGDVTNDLTSLVADPNVSIHEGKAFMCNVERVGSG